MRLARDFLTEGIPRNYLNDYLRLPKVDSQCKRG